MNVFNVSEYEIVRQQLGQMSDALPSAKVICISTFLSMNVLCVIKYLCLCVVLSS